MKKRTSFRQRVRHTWFDLRGWLIRKIAGDAIVVINLRVEFEPLPADASSSVRVDPEQRDMMISGCTFIGPVPGQQRLVLGYSAGARLTA